MNYNILFSLILLLIALNSATISILGWKLSKRLGNINQNVVKICERHNYQYSTTTNVFCDLKTVEIK